MMPENEKEYLSDGERLDDLQFKGMKVIQGVDCFKFGTDSVLLAGFCRVGAKAKCVDLGAGCGVLSILVHARTNCNVTAVEIDEKQFSRIERSIELNHIGEKVKALRLDYITEYDKIGIGRYDAVICNPPYFRSDCGTISNSGSATHELFADIDGVAKAAEKLLKFGGKLFMCFPAGRLCEAVFSLKMHGIEPKVMRFVAAAAETRPYLVLIEGKKGAKPGVIIERNLIIYEKNKQYTEEVKRIYHEQQ